MGDNTFLIVIYLPYHNMNLWDFDYEGVIDAKNATKINKNPLTNGK